MDSFERAVQVRSKSARPLWAIFGSGAVVSDVLESFGVEASDRFCGIISRNPTAAKDLCSRFGLNSAWIQTDGSLKEAAADVVYIATPHQAHYAIALQLLARGIPVYCEKPVCLSVTALQKLVELSCSKQVFFGEALKTPFLPTIKLMLDVIASGAIGIVREIDASFCFMAGPKAPSRLFDPSRGGGSWRDLGSYLVWLSTAILGPVKGLTANAELTNDGIDRSTKVTFQHEQGVSTLQSSIVDAGSKPTVIVGECGRISVEHFWAPHQFTLEVDGAPLRVLSAEISLGGFKEQFVEVDRCLTMGRIELAEHSHARMIEVVELLEAVGQEIGLAPVLEYEEGL